MRRSAFAIAALAPLLLAVTRSQAEPARTWELEASVGAYIVPDEADYLQPTVRFDREWLHLEGRYDYEDLRTGSLFVGWNFGIGERWRLELTPMLGGVFGHTMGVAPALGLALTWGPFDLLSESEYVVDARDVSDSFFYSWSELGARLGDHVRLGLVVQRTRVPHTTSEVALGPFFTVSLWKLFATAYFFDPAAQSRFVVVALAATF